MWSKCYNSSPPGIYACLTSQQEVSHFIGVFYRFKIVLIWVRIKCVTNALAVFIHGSHCSLRRHCWRQFEICDEDYSGASCSFQALSQSQACFGKWERLIISRAVPQPFVHCGACTRCCCNSSIGPIWRLTACQRVTHARVRRTQLCIKSYRKWNRQTSQSGPSWLYFWRKICFTSQNNERWYLAQVLHSYIPAIRMNCH